MTEKYPSEMIDEMRAAIIEVEFAILTAVANEAWTFANPTELLLVLCGAVIKNSFIRSGNPHAEITDEHYSWMMENLYDIRYEFSNALPFPVLDLQRAVLRYMIAQLDLLAAKHLGRTVCTH